MLVYECNGCQRQFLTDVQPPPGELRNPSSDTPMTCPWASYANHPQQNQVHYVTEWGGANHGLRLAV